MRPNTQSNPEKLYECFTCGARVRGPPENGCPDCGNELMNLAQSRDL